MTFVNLLATGGESINRFDQCSNV